MTAGRWRVPRRPGLLAAREAVRGSASARHAWQDLAARALIPTTWVATAARRFIDDPQTAPTRDPAFAPTLDHPADLDACALFAADVDGVSAAERSARELAARLAPWGAPGFDHVRWWTISRGRYNAASTDTRPGVSYALLFACQAVWSARPDIRGHVFGNAHRWALAWAELARDGACVSNARDDVRTPRTFAELPDPFAPLAEIEAAGYATLEWMTVDGGLVLVSPRE